MSYVVMTLAALGAIGSGLFALLAWAGQYMSDSPRDAQELGGDARTAAWVCAICIVILVATWRGAHA